MRTIKDFLLGGARNTSSRTGPFSVKGDHPPELLGTNKGPTSVELVLAALGHCIASGFAAYGAHMGIPIDSLRVEVEGDVDLQSRLALPEPDSVRPGFQEIMARYYVRSKAKRKQLEQLAKMVEDFSPTKDSLRAVKFSSQLIAQSPPRRCGMIIIWYADFEGTNKDLARVNRILEVKNYEWLNQAGRVFLKRVQDEGLKPTPTRYEVAVTPQEFWGK